MINQATQSSYAHIRDMITCKATRHINFRTDDVKAKIDRLPSRLKSELTKAIKGTSFCLSPRLKELILFAAYRKSLRLIKSHAETYELFGVCGGGFKSTDINPATIRKLTQNNISKLGY